MNRRRKRLLTAAAVFIGITALPAALVSLLLARVAVDRRYKSRLMEIPGVKQAVRRLSGFLTPREKLPEHRGKCFDDFRDEINAGKKWFIESRPERVSITSYDRLKLTGFYLPAEKDTGRTLILMHGYRADGYSDFSCLMRFFHEAGYHLLVPHQRSHGESEGRAICFGVKERYDVKQWAEYLTDRFGPDLQIALAGISMGAATVMMAAGLELPGQVKGIIADCGYTSPWDILKHELNTVYHLPDWPFLYAAERICAKTAGFTFRECSALDAMRNCRIPVLFIHGGDDDFVPLEMSIRNYEACGAKKRLLIIEGAAHGTSNMVDRDKYRDTALEFLSDVMQSRPAD